LHDPFLFRFMTVACERIWQAMEAGDRIIIHGDYDADGVTGSVVLMDTFRTIAKKQGWSTENIISYIPHREKEGYGLSVDTVHRLAKEGATLIITVDCGIGCAKEIALAK